MSPLAQTRGRVGALAVAAGLVVALVLAFNARGWIVQQPEEISAPERQRVLDAARSIMLAVGSAALVSLDADGRPQARAMDPFPPEPDLSVWMATRSGTRKLQQLSENPQALLYYFDAAGGGYVSLHGEVRIVQDSAERERRWKPAWANFYDDENRGDDYVLLQLVPTRVEVVSLEHAIAAEPKAWKPAIVELR